MAITQKFKDDLIKASEALEKWKSQGNNYFNIFDALGVVHKENYHSAFIAYLLDKNSEHYQSRFVELFLEKLQKENTIPNKVFGNLSVENLQNVETEAVTEKIAQNRRVDILLRFDNFVNIIKIKFTPKTKIHKSKIMLRISLKIKIIRQIKR